MIKQVTIALQTDKPLTAYGPLAKMVEEYGFDGVSVYNDLYFQPAWMPLLEIARATRRLRIGAAAVNPFTAHPIQIAGNLAVVDEASDGRAYCGFARGAWLDSLGLHPTAPIAALHEALQVVRHLLKRDPAPFPGAHFPLTGGQTLRWAEIRPDIPFLLGSWGEKTIRRCLPWVTEIKLGGTANPGAVRWLRGVLQQADSAAGVVCGAVTVVDEDGRAAKARARREVALYLPVVAALDKSITIEPERIAGIHRAMQEQNVDEAVRYISDELLDRFAFAGTPDQVAAQAAALFAAGADRVEFGTPHGLDPAAGLHLLGALVLPAVRTAVGEGK
jgi:5,10-methylenetetrahydromethanopterin reductase